MTNSNDNLQRHARYLQSEARHQAQNTQLAKLGGGVALSAGLMSVATGGIAAIPIVLGGALYFGATAREAKNTGRWMPLPFSNIDPWELINARKDERDADFQTTVAHQYLSQEDKADYLLCTVLRAVTEKFLAAAADEVDAEVRYEHMKQQLIRNYSNVQGVNILDNPDQAIPGLFGNTQTFVDGFKSALPAELAQDIDPELLLEPHVPTRKTPSELIEAEVIVDAEYAEYSDSSTSTAAALNSPTENDRLRLLSEADMKGLLGFPLLMLYGGQGSGKTTLTQWLTYAAVDMSYRVVVADPDYRKGDWKGLPVLGKAGNYSQCDELMERVTEICEHRYQQRAELGKEPEDFEPLLVVFEEFTNWSSACGGTADFMRLAIQKFRKANIHLLLITHSDTLTGLGGATGLSTAIRTGSVKLNPLAEKQMVNGVMKPRPKGVAYLTELGEDQGMVRVMNLKDWKIPQNVEAKDFSLKGSIKDLEGLTRTNKVNPDHEGSVDQEAAKNTSTGTSKFDESAFAFGDAFEAEVEEHEPEVSPELQRWNDGKAFVKSKGFDYIVDLMNWAERRDAPFTVENIRGSKALREGIESSLSKVDGSATDKIRHLLTKLVEQNLMKEVSEDGGKTSYAAVYK